LKAFPHTSRGKRLDFKMGVYHPLNYEIHYKLGNIGGQYKKQGLKATRKRLEEVRDFLEENL
jgi:hypothetical protein